MNESAAACSKDEMLAFGTVLSEESYASLLEAQEDSTREDRDGYTVFTEEEGAMCFVAPVAPAAPAEEDAKDEKDKADEEEPETIYVMLRVYDGAVGEDAWARVSCEPAGFNLKEPTNFATGVIADAIDPDIRVKVTLELPYDFSALFLPMAFYLYNEDTPEDDFEIYGTIMNKENYDEIVKIHTEDKTLEEKEGYVMYTADGYAGILAPVDDSETEYITLITYDPIDVESIWELVSYEVF